MKREYQFAPEKYQQDILQILLAVNQTESFSPRKLQKLLSKYPRDGNAVFSRDQLVQGYHHLVKTQQLPEDQSMLDKIRMKPTRTISGVAPVTVLTKPFPCPGKCIYCPNDVRMPKSYLVDEPGAQRAERNAFDPYLQTYNRIQAFANTGHSVDKIELIVLGGTWSFYPESYQIWFIKRCFDAMNDFGQRDQRAQVKTTNIFEEADRVPRQRVDGKNKSYNEIVSAVAHGESQGFFTQTESASWEELEAQQQLNENATCRNVGLVIETRPDYIDQEEVIKLRRLGATKIQIGIQSLSDEVQKLNKRGHGAKEVQQAITLLRIAGFKIHAHWMPNLYGSNPRLDMLDYQQLWQPAYCPDELKIYPTSIIANTELNQLYLQGKYQPYSYEELLRVLMFTFEHTPRFCRLTRVIRDIPSTDIVAGNKLTNFREIAEKKLNQEGKYCKCIRCREIKNRKVGWDELELETIVYKSSIGQEYFLSYKTKSDDKIVGFLRLAIPNKQVAAGNFIAELQDCAIIREVHVYGQVADLGSKDQGRSQHLGIGKTLINKAKEIALAEKFEKIAVISAIGTRGYYKKQGFDLEKLYMVSKIPS